MTIIEEFTKNRKGRKTTCSQVLPCFHSLQVKGDPVAASAWTVTLEGSQDGVNWTVLLTHNTGDGTVIWAADAIPRAVRHLRIQMASINLGSATKVRAIAVSVPAG